MSRSDRRCPPRLGGQRRQTEFIPKDVVYFAIEASINIYKETAMLREQNHVIAGLRTKGFLSEEKYREQTAELNRKINKLQKELNMLTNTWRSGIYRKTH